MSVQLENRVISSVQWHIRNKTSPCLHQCNIWGLIVLPQPVFHSEPMCLCVWTDWGLPPLSVPAAVCPSHHGLWSFVPQHGVWVPRLLQQVPGGVSGRQDDHEGQHSDPWQAQRSGVHPADRRLPHPLLLEGSDNRERGWCRWHSLNGMLARPESECQYEPFLLFSLRTWSSSLMTASSSGWTSAPPDEFMCWSSRLAPKDSSSGCRYVSERSVTHGCVHEV